MNFFKLAVFLGLGLFLQGCFSTPIDEKLLELESKFRSVTSYREMRSVSGGSTEYYFLLSDGKLVTRRTKGPDGSITLDMYKEAQAYEIRGRRASRKASAMFSLDLTFVPMGYSGFPRFNMESLTFSGYEIVGEVECAIFEARDDKQETTFWIGADDGIVRKHTYRNDTLTMATVVIESTVLHINSVNQSKFELPSGVIIKKVSAQEAALNATIADLTKKQRAKSR